VVTDTTCLTLNKTQNKQIDTHAQAGARKKVTRQQEKNFEEITWTKKQTRVPTSTIPTTRAPLQSKPLPFQRYSAASWAATPHQNQCILSRLTSTSDPPAWSCDETLQWSYSSTSRGFSLVDRQVFHHTIGGFCRFLPQTQRPLVSFFHMLAIHWSSLTARSHTITEFLIPPQTGVFCNFLTRRQDLRASRCWWPIGQAQKHESSPSWTHLSQKHFWISWIFWIFWIFCIFFRDGGPTPPGLRVAYPHIVPTSPWPQHEIPFVADHLVSQLSGVHERQRT